MRTNTLVTLGASAAFGLMAVFLARSWINDAVRSEFAGRKSTASMPVTAQAIETQSVIVADIDLGFGAMLDPQVLRIVDMPVDMVPAGSFTHFEALLGSGDERTIVLSRMGYNEPILDYKVSGPGGRGSLSAVIAPGMRAASIRVNAVAGVGGFVLPGDHVDVILTRDVSVGEQNRKLTSDVLLQNVKVLGADQNADNTSNAVKVVQTVTLEVAPTDAQKLSLAMDVGSLSLTLRRAGMTEIAPSAVISEHSLTGNSKPVNSYASRSVKAKPAPSGPRIVRADNTESRVANVTIIRSGERESVSVHKETLDDAELAPALTDAPVLAGGAKG